MLIFDPRFTEVIHFDIECYVPPGERTSGKSSMIYNPNIPTHFILGGAFQRSFPLQHKVEPIWHVWGWEKHEEKETLQQIYNFFRESWKLIEGKTSENPDLILVGTGISRLDVPSLYVRSVINGIDSAKALFETYFKTKIVELGDVGIPLFKNRGDIYPIYPKTTNALMTRFHLQTRKMSGKSVWDLYDSGDFNAIGERTINEVENLMSVTNCIEKGIF